MCNLHEDLSGKNDLSAAYPELATRLLGKLKA